MNFWINFGDFWFMPSSPRGLSGCAVFAMDVPQAMRAVDMNMCFTTQHKDLVDFGLIFE